MVDISRPDIQASFRSPRAAFFKPSYHGLGLFVACGDAVMIMAASVVCGVIYHLLVFESAPDYAVYIGIGVVAYLGYEVIAWNFGLYRPRSLLETRRDYGQIVAAWLGAILVLLLLFFLLKLGHQISRGVVVSFVGLGVAALISWRKLVKTHVRRTLEAGTIEGRRALLLGTEKELASLSSSRLLLSFGFHEIDRIVLPDGRAGGTIAAAQSAAIEVALQRSRLFHAEEIILAISWSNSSLIEFVRAGLRSSPLRACLLPDSHVRSVYDAAAISNLPLLEMQRTPLTRMERVVKRSFDLALACGGLLFFSPLLLAIAALIKLDSKGPVIFRQRRNGFNGREFFIYKFRTMNVLEDGPRIVQAQQNDSRVTRVGRVLRRLSIDELPQLLNVLRGDMSFAGPRPHALAHDDEYGAQIDEYALRHHVKPGITGWAQVNGFRGETRQIEQMIKRVEFDLWYINNWSITLDIQIVFRTVFELLRRRNAY